MVSRTDGLGDVIVTLPMAVALREHLPDTAVAYLVSPYTAPLVRRIPEIDDVFTVDRHGRAREALRASHPDAIVFAKPELRLALDAFRARIPRRIGTGYRLYSGLFTQWVYEHRKTGTEHESRYGVNLLNPLISGDLKVRMPSLTVSLEGSAQAGRKLVEAGVGSEYMVIHPGNRGSAASYPPEQYAKIAGDLLGEFPGLTVLVTAGPGEEELAGRIASDAGSRAKVVADLPLDGFSELLRNASGFLGSSSGPAHLAALVGASVVGLYPGLPPMWPVRWRPLGDWVSTLVPEPAEPWCAACGKAHEPENCVARILPERVLDMCRRMLAGGTPLAENDIS